MNTPAQVRDSSSFSSDFIETNEKIPPFDPYIDDQKRRNDQSFCEEEKLEDDDLEESKISAPYPSPLELYQNLSTTTLTAKSTPASLAEIFEGTVEQITFMQKEGITETSFTVNSSVFEAVDVHIDYYDTAPDSFNITFSGGALFQKTAAKHLDTLADNLKTALPNFHCNVLPPEIKLPLWRRRLTKKKGIVDSERLRYSTDKKDGNRYDD